MASSLRDDLRSHATCMWAAELDVYRRQAIDFAFSGPVAGMCSDRVSSAWGRRRPILVAGSLVASAGLRANRSLQRYKKDATSRMSRCRLCAALFCKSLVMAKDVYAGLACDRDGTQCFLRRPCRIAGGDLSD